TVVISITDGTVIPDKPSFQEGQVAHMRSRHHKSRDKKAFAGCGAIARRPFSRGNAVESAREFAKKERLKVTRPPRRIRREDHVHSARVHGQRHPVHWDRLRKNTLTKTDAADRTTQHSNHTDPLPPALLRYF